VFKNVTVPGTYRTLFVYISVLYVPYLVTPREERSDFRTAVVSDPGVEVRTEMIFKPRKS
jgi:hypothetical protein